jgi:hypothetical protein
MQLTHRRVAPALIFLLASSSTACQAWHVEKKPVEAVVRQHPAGPVALTMHDKRWVVLESPRLERDSVVGIRTGGNTFGKGRTALPLNGIRSVETRRFSILRTLYLAAGAALIPSIYRLAVEDND